jgi:glycosyltransferase involved in cell wall biosynthesis
VTASRVSWLPAEHPKAAFIPIGANIPERSAEARVVVGDERCEKIVTVFCFTPSRNRELEIGDIVHAARTAHREGRPIHLAIVGRGSKEILPEIESGLAGSGVRVSASGIISSEDISRSLAKSDVLLFVSGQVSQTRGSALAGVACGLPVVGYGGAAEGTAIAEAGLALAPYRSREALGDALSRVIGDANLRGELRRRSLEAQRKYFSWDAIAEKYVAACTCEAAAGASFGRAHNSSLQSPGIS